MPAETLVERPWQRRQIPTAKVLRACLRTALYERLSRVHQIKCDHGTRLFLDRVEILGVLNHIVTMREAVRVAFSCALLYAGRPDLDFPPKIGVRISPMPFDKHFLPCPDGIWAGYVTPNSGEVWLWTRSIDYSFNRSDGYHSPLHEFAHALDCGIFEPRRPLDGIPRDLNLLRRDAWLKALHRVRKRAGEKSDPYTIRKYAATDPAEAFACAVEAFFEQPRELRKWDPEVYGMLSEFLRQDPARFD